MTSSMFNPNYSKLSMKCVNLFSASFRLVNRLSLSVACLLGTSLVANSVIFLHPDGTGLGHWNAGRLVIAGPDGVTNWDKMERIAAYRVHQKNKLSTTSHAGATTHAYGKKVHTNSFGLDRTEPLTALSGKPLTILEEAQAAGIRTGLINTGHIAEPGTAVFAARSEMRKAYQTIAQQVLESDTELMFFSGEVYLIPTGVIGRHGQPGTREDGRNLLNEAASRGYTIIYTREELLNLSPDTTKVIGIFAATNTFNTETEELVQQQGKPFYVENTPTYAEMVAVALKILGSDSEKDFFLVAEEEATDNFSNKLNAGGMLEAVSRADDAIGEALSFLTSNEDRQTLLIVAADSDAGSPTIFSRSLDSEDATALLPRATASGASIHGVMGVGSEAFVSKPDARGNSHPFGIIWATTDDTPGSAVTKASGYKSEHLKASIDNTDIYRLIYSVLFEP